MALIISYIAKQYEVSLMLARNTLNIYTHITYIYLLHLLKYQIKYSKYNNQHNIITLYLYSDGSILIIYC